MLRTNNVTTLTEPGLNVHFSYTRSQLLSIQSSLCKISRPVRKRLFQLQLWKPSNCWQDSRNGPSHQWLRSLPKANVQPKPKRLNCAFVNVRSIRNKVDDFLHHVQTADYDVCFITETWLRLNDPLDDAVIAQLKTNGCNFHHSPRLEGNRGGGLAVFSNSSVTVTPLRQHIYSTFELGMWNVKSKGLSFIVVCVYRPPYSQRHPKTVKAFIDEFEEVWSSIMTSHDTTKLVLVGDFNIHWDNQENGDTLAFHELINSFGCVQHVGIPTHELGHTIDLCITPSDTKLNLTPPAADYFISDHAFLSFYVDIPRPPVEKTVVASRPIRNMNIVSFRTELQEVCDTIMHHRGKDLADKYDSELAGLLDRHAPLMVKEVRVRKKVAWFDGKAREMKKELRSLERRWKKSGARCDLDTFKLKKKLYRGYLRQNRVHHFRDAIHQAKGNSRQLYSVTLGLMGRSQQNVLPEMESEKELADKFAAYFLSKIEAIREELKDIPKFVPSLTCTDNLSAFQPLTCDEVLKLVKKSKPTTTITDPLPSNLVKQHIDILCPLLTKLINESLTNAQFFDQWKLAVVVPLLKKIGLDLILPSYRPVSNLNFASKIAEKGSILQINDHIRRCNLTAAHQSAYKEHFSCETAVVYLMNHLLWNMERGRVSVITGLDLSAAFDTVDHGVLAAVLERGFGVTGNALDWIKSYLLDRRLCVKVGTEVSSNLSFNFSVPQGSCLGPVLFNIYSSTISECIQPEQDLGGYADDHVIWDSFIPSSEGKERACLNRMESTLLRIKSWMDANSLKMNTTKTEFAYFGSRQMLAKIAGGSINVAGDVVPPSSQLKYLGVCLDGPLTLNDFISNKVKCAASAIRSIKAIRQYIDIDTAKVLVCSLVLTRLDFINSILCGLPLCQLERLQRIQNWAAKVVLGSAYVDPESALKSLHWLPINERINFKILCLVHKCLHNSEPKYLKDLLHFKTFTRSTRASTSPMILSVPRTVKATFASRAFSVQGPILWNKLPVSLREATDFKTFKRHLKTHIFKAIFRN